MQRLTYLRELARRHGSAFSLDLHLDRRPSALRRSLALLAFHLLGLLAVFRLTHQPLWLVLFPVLLIQPIAISWRLKRWHLLPESFAPLWVAYGVLALRLLVAIAARMQGLTSGALTVPQPCAGWLNLNMAAALGGLWALLAQAGPMAEALGRHVDRKTLLGSVLAGLSLAWAALTYLAIRTAGVTASDPYAYVQMAVDITRHGTPLHAFALVPKVAAWGLPVWPLAPVGYMPPDPATGTAATVWSPGYSAFLAAAYWVGGEPGLYALTPLLGLVTLAATWRLGLEVAQPWASHRRLLAAGLALFILATSYEQIDRLAVPMADIPAQLFSILTIYYALRTSPRRVILSACLTGLCLGIAFAMRYTQALLGFGVLLIWILTFSPYRPGSRQEFLLAVTCFGATALGIAVPVLWYHQVAFGGIFRVGWSEFHLFGFGYMPRTSINLVTAFLSRNEFLYLAPFLLWGMIRLWRIHRRAAIGLLTWLLVIVSFHLLYAAVRLRDVLSVFPVLALWAGIGMVDMASQIRRIGQPIWRKRIGVVMLGLVIGLLAVRSQVTLPLAFYAKDFYTFGYLRAGQRADFDVLAGLAPPGSIVATSLNSGPIELYTGRHPVRPAYWSQSEWLDFVAQAFKDGRRVYLLLDGVEMHGPLKTVQSRYQLSQIALLDVPYFNPDGTTQDIDVSLYEVLNSNSENP